VKFVYISLLTDYFCYCPYFNFKMCWSFGYFS